MEFIGFPSPMGIFFVFIDYIFITKSEYISFRPLWGAFLFLSLS